MTGEITLLFFEQGSIKGDLSDFLDWFFIKYNVLRDGEYFWRYLGIFTLFSEGLLSFGLWIPRLRRFSIFIGLIFHLGLDLTMGVQTFSFQMIALYIAFINPKSRQNIVFYDKYNRWHKIMVRTGKLLDWFRRFKWEGYQSSSYRNSKDNNDTVSITKEVSAYSSNNKFRSGFSAIIFIFTLFPLTFIPFYFFSLLNNLRLRYLCIK